jgi:hypothetical protein
MSWLPVAAVATTPVPVPFQASSTGIGKGWVNAPVNPDSESKMSV